MIIFNSKSYNSLEEMPASERQAYEQIAGILVDKNGNGIPDFLEGDMAKNVMTAFTSSVIVNGKTYNGMNELPLEVRAKVQGAFEKMSELGIVTKVSPMMTQAQNIQVDQAPVVSSTPLVSSNPSIQEEKSNPMMWALIGMGLMLCLALAAVGIFFLMNR